MNLKDYQEKAVQELTEYAAELWQKNGSKKIVFKSPTGSGKTVMMAEFLKRFADAKSALPFCCIWTAPRKLHEQSKEKLEKYYEDSMALNCSYFDDLTDKRIAENEILFLNWESIRQENAVIIRENERDLYLAKVLENSKESGCEIILIIDESHYHLTEISQELISDIAPKLILEVSATPVMQQPDKMVAVDIDDVKKAGMIKKSIILNDSVKNAISGGGIKTAGNADDFLLKQALAKRKELAAAFLAEGAEINPLLCIQLPDRRTQQDDILQDKIYQILGENGITEENRKLAIYLSDEKENLENISRNDNESEVMLFKQAIALGWDCPRAHILVLFRDWHNGNFSVQTLGRIMRMPEPEKGHYKDETLNSAYIYTNKEEVHIAEDISGGYICIYTAYRIDEYAPLKLPSVHRLRQREKTQLSPLFNKLFLMKAKEYELKDKINMRAQQVESALISDYESENIDRTAGESITGGVKFNVENEGDLQKLYDHFVNKNLSPYYPDDRSIGRVKSAIYDFFGGPLEMKVAEDFDKIINIILSRENKSHFVHVLADTKIAYKNETEKRKEPLQITSDWEIPEKINYTKNHAICKTEKSVMQPFCAANNESAPEKEFIKFLEKSEKVKWWYKNGESESMYFAVPYLENSEIKPFYADFIVQFTDGKTGIYDTKSGMTINMAKDKSDGLLKYIKEMNGKGKKITGGIVAPDNPDNYSQGWKIYAGEGKDLTSDVSAPGWSWLEI